LHTAIDDLESFLWVLLWAILHVIRHHAKLSTDEDKWITGLSNGDVQGLLAEKANIKDRLNDLMFCDGTSKGLKPFGRLLQIWFDYALQASRELGLELNNPSNNDKFQMFCHGWYEKYIKTGLGYMEDLPDTWSEIFS
jgi:hypothetical protein